MQQELLLVYCIPNKIINLIAAKESSYYNNSKKPIKRVYIAKYYSYYGK